MSEVTLMARAAGPFLEIIDGVQWDHWGAPTPCGDYDVYGLVNHLLFWGPSLEGAARKKVVPPPAASDTDLDVTGPDWAAALEAQTGRLVDGWSRPAAWEGTTFMGGQMELPAAMVGGMVVGELVVHGWDLAVATGQHAAWDDDLLARLRDEVAKGAEIGRQMGVYGPEVAVPETAPLLHRVLGLTGRDPAAHG